MGNKNSTPKNKVDTSQPVLTDDIYDTADVIYLRTTGDDADKGFYVERSTVEVYTDPVRGLTLPYIADRNAYPVPYQTESLFDPTMSSENPRYVEIVVCRGDLEEKGERFAVNKQQPDHECKGNCYCIEEIYQITKMNKPTVLSATSSERTGPQKKAASKTPAKCKPMVGGSYLMKGGQDDMMNTDTSPEEITESEEENDLAFSPTSDMSDTTTSPAKPKEQQKKKKPAEMFDTSDNDEEQLDEDVDDDDEDLELDEEEVTEDGYILQLSDITSSDLYKMQRRIFESETEDEGGLDDDDETTDRVREAMRKMNARGNMFDSEDRAILNLTSSTEKYMNKPTRRNDKYSK